MTVIEYESYLSVTVVEAAIIEYWEFICACHFGETVTDRNRFEYYLILHRITKQAARMYSVRLWNISRNYTSVTDITDILNYPTQEK